MGHLNEGILQKTKEFETGEKEDINSADDSPVKTQKFFLSFFTCSLNLLCLAKFSYGLQFQEERCNESTFFQCWQC